jgi:glycosyltransferase involved in cell wall biosynthesis
MRRLLIVQPYLTRYRIPVFEELAERYEVLVAASPSSTATGFGLDAKQHAFGLTEVPEMPILGGKLGMWQQGLIRTMRRFKPDLIFITANPRYLSFWAVLILARLLSIPVFAHGQGLYRKRGLSLGLRVAYTALVRLATAYVCYTEASRQSFQRLGFGPATLNKLRVAENSLSLSATLPPQERTGNERGILFVGRLRAGNGLPMLLAVCEKLREKHPVELHIVGGGEEEATVREACADKDWVHLHGLIYDQARIRDISKECLVGCYPGDAGLSVLHYMSLSLPPVAHNDLPGHMGPEPSYIEDGVNGFLYDAANREADLGRVLNSIFEAPEALAPVREAAYATYEKVSFPSLAQRFMTIFKEHGA